MIRQMELWPPRSVVACSRCGKPIVVYERTAEGIASEYQDAQGRCFDCAKKA